MAISVEWHSITYRHHIKTGLINVTYRLPLFVWFVLLVYAAKISFKEQALVAST
jgi:hypothetical protein